MSIFLINGSPRKNGNTGTLLDNATEGIESREMHAETIRLYDFDYRGCISCFYCKRKDKEHGHCAMKDGLSPVLEELKEADGIIFASPVYYDNITSGMAAFLERFLFSNYIYSDEIPTVFPKKIPTAFIYSMNITEEQAKRIHLYSNLEKYQKSIKDMPYLLVKSSAASNLT